MACWTTPTPPDRCSLKRRRSCCRRSSRVSPPSPTCCSSSICATAAKAAISPSASARSRRSRPDVMPEEQALEQLQRILARPEFQANESRPWWEQLLEPVFEWLFGLFAQVWVAVADAASGREGWL